MHFEAVVADHADELAALFERNSVPSVTAGFDPFPLTRDQARRIALEAHKDAFYVVACDRRLVGFSMLRGFDAGYIVPSFGIFVDRECQGQGLGRRLTVWTIEQARRRGSSAVRLSVYAENSTAMSLYASLGFSVQERQTVERAGQLQEKIIMSLDLEG